LGARENVSPGPVVALDGPVLTFQQPLLLYLAVIIVAALTYEAIPRQCLILVSFTIGVLVRLHI